MSTTTVETAGDAAEVRALREALGDAHDALQEALAACWDAEALQLALMAHADVDDEAARRWAALPVLTQQPAWADLKARIDALLPDAPGAEGGATR